MKLDGLIKRRMACYTPITRVPWQALRQIKIRTGLREGGTWANSSDAHFGPCGRVAPQNLDPTLVRFLVWLCH